MSTLNEIQYFKFEIILHRLTIKPVRKKKNSPQYQCVHAFNDLVVGL